MPAANEGKIKGCINALYSVFVDTLGQLTEHRQASELKGEMLYQLTEELEEARRYVYTWVYLCIRVLTRPIRGHTCPYVSYAWAYVSLRGHTCL